MLDPARRRRAVEALAVLGRTDDVVRALVDPEPEIRARAAELLGESGDDRAMDHLERAAGDPVTEVAGSARRAVERLDAGRHFAPVS
jgi:HEAT repeat protein